MDAQIARAGRIVASAKAGSYTELAYAHASGQRHLAATAAPAAHASRCPLHPKTVCTDLFRLAGGMSSC